MSCCENPIASYQGSRTECPNGVSGDLKVGSKWKLAINSWKAKKNSSRTI